MAFSFRKLSSDSNEDASASNQGIPPLSRGLAPKGFLSRILRQDVDSSPSAPPLTKSPGWQARDHSAITNPDARPPAFIPVTQLAAFLPTHYLRANTRLITYPVDLSSILQPSRLGDRSYKTYLSAVSELLPELFTREINPSDDRAIQIPIGAFSQAEASTTSSRGGTVADVVPEQEEHLEQKLVGSAVATASQQEGVDQGALSAGASVISSSLPQPRQPGVAPLSGGDQSGISFPGTETGVRNAGSALPGKTTITSPFGSPFQKNSREVGDISSLPVSPFSTQVPASFHGNEGSSEVEIPSFELSLNEILAETSQDALGFDPSKIPPHVMVKLPGWSKKNLSATGHIKLPLDMIIKGCENRYRPAFARAQDDVMVSIPLQKMSQDLPQGKSISGPSAPPAGELIGANSQTPGQEVPASSSSAKGPRPTVVARTALSSLPEIEREDAPVTPPPPRAEDRLQFGSLNPPSDLEESRKPEVKGEAGQSDKAANALRSLSTGPLPTAEKKEMGDSSTPSVNSPRETPVFGSEIEPKTSAVNGNGRSATSDSGIDSAVSTKPGEDGFKSRTNGVTADTENASHPTGVAVSSALRQIANGINGREDLRSNLSTTSASAVEPTHELPPREAKNPIVRKTEKPGRPVAALELQPGEIPDQLELRAIFGVSRPIALPEVLDRCALLGGIDSCLVITPAGVVCASNKDDATGARANFYKRAANIYDSVAKLAGEIGIEDISILNVKTAAGTITYFRCDDLCLAVMLNHDKVEGGVSEKLIVVTRELSELIKG